MAPPKDIARSYPKRGLTADVGFRSEPKFCGDGSFEAPGYPTSGPMLNYAMNHTFSAFTCASWVYLNGDSTYNIYMSAGDVASGCVSFGWINGNAVPQLRLFDRANSSVSYIPTQGFSEARKQWSHVAVTINGAGDTIKMYVNGVLVTGTPQPTAGNEIAMPTSDGSSLTHFNVGSFQYSTSGSSLSIGGNLANFGLYDAELTQDQIRQLMRASDYESCSAVATPQVFFELFDSWAESTGNIGATQEVQTPVFTQKRPQLPRGLDLARGAAMARVYTGRAVDFDGSADRITAAHYNPSGDYLTTTAWVNADTLRVQGMIHNGNTGRNSFLFVMNDASGNADFYWNDTTGDARIRHQTQLAAARWYHLAAVMDMSDPADHQVTFYIDGIAATGTRTSAGWVGDNTYQFGNQYATAGWFDGKIADCRIYDVALTQAQIRELYHNPEQVLPTGVSASNLRRYYPLSDYNDTGGTGGRYFQDMGADGEPAEDQGSCTMAFAQPVPCPQLGLQQSATRLLMRNASADKATVTLPSAPGSSFSFQIWLYLNSVSFNFALQYGDIDIAGEGLTIRISSGAVTTYDAPDGLLSGLSVSEGEWSHIVYATSDSSPYWRVWVNGTEASSPQALTGGARTGASTSLTIGRSPNYGFTPDGIISNCAFWTTQLDTPDVAALYNSGDQNVDVSTVQSSSLVGWWKCDDFTKFKNYANPGTADATVTGSPIGASFPENASGSTIVGDFSMKRKGASILNINNDQGYAYALGQDKPSYFPKAGATGYTMSLAHRPIKTGITEIFWGNDNPTGTPGNDQFILFMNPNGSYQWQLGDGSSRPPAVSAAGVADGEWHIITLTIDYSVSPARWTIYADGIQSTTGTASISGPPGNFYDVSFGRWRSGGYKGSSASGCYRFYDVALSADEVERLAFSDLRLIKGLANE